VGLLAYRLVIERNIYFSIQGPSFNHQKINDKTIYALMDKHHHSWNEVVLVLMTANLHTLAKALLLLFIFYNSFSKLKLRNQWILTGSAGRS